MSVHIHAAMNHALLWASWVVSFRCVQTSLTGNLDCQAMVASKAEEGLLYMYKKGYESCVCKRLTDIRHTHLPSRGPSVIPGLRAKAQDQK